MAASYELQATKERVSHQNRALESRTARLGHATSTQGGAGERKRQGQEAFW